MSSRPARIGLVVGALLLAVVALLVLSPDGEDEAPPRAQATEQGVDPEQAEDPAPEEARAEGGHVNADDGAEAETGGAPAPPVQDVVRAEIGVTGGQPEGGVQRVTAQTGDAVEIAITSDRADELHLHGYDLEKPLAAGKPTQLNFDAELEGIFELELHSDGTLLAEIEVAP